MEGYRYQQFAYLLIPVVTGIEFFRCARSVRKTSGKESAAAVAMDAFGYVFILIVPAIFLFTIPSIEYRRFPIIVQLLHRFDRYGVMFLFLGAWWQIFLITALRARQTANTGGSLFRCVWLPYLVLGFYVSALVLWVAPFNLMWVSVFWFVASWIVFSAHGTAASKVSTIFFILAGVVFFGENIFFIILDAIV